MSKANKARQKAIIAKQFTATRKAGGKGPAKTQPKHGKQRMNRDFWKRANAAVLKLEEEVREKAKRLAQSARKMRDDKEPSKPRGKKPERPQAAA